MWWKRKKQSSQDELLDKESIVNTHLCPLCNSPLSSDNYCKNCESKLTNGEDNSEGIQNSVNDETYTNNQEDNNESTGSNSQEDMA